MFDLFSRPLELKRFVDVEKPVEEISSKRPVVLRDNERVLDAINLMLERFRRVPVVDAHMNLKGIITMVDILDLLGGGEKYEILARRRGSLKIPVRKVMERHVITMDRKISTRKALEIFKREGRGAYPILHRKKLVGIISEWDFIKLIKGNVDVLVGHLMTRRPIILKPNYSLLDAMKTICRAGFRRLPVVEDSILIGIITPRDILIYLRENESLDRMEMAKVKINEVMERNLAVMYPETRLMDAIKTMRLRRVGGLPVTDGDELVGILTERDIIEAFA